MVKPEAMVQHMFQKTIGLHSSLLEVNTEVVEKRLSVGHIPTNHRVISVA